MDILVNQNSNMNPKSIIPEVIHNFIDNRDCESVDKLTFPNLDPTNGEVICLVSRSDKKDVIQAVQSAKKAQPGWAQTPPVQRGLILHQIVVEMMNQRDQIAGIVSKETGKSFKDALGETGAAIQCGLFYASEGQRLYGKTTSSGTPNKFASTIRQPIGIAGLIIAANTPIANVAWKVFPALICGNTAILKPSEDTPATAWIFAQIAKKAGLPNGVLNIIQGYGTDAGTPLVENEDVGIISFTGSTLVGKQILGITAERLARVSLELGGKNALVICDDADLDNAVNWVLLSSFSNAGQRCAASSRIIIFETIYDQVKQLLISKTNKLKIGNSDQDDLGPVINLKQLNNMLESINLAEESGANILAGGYRLTGTAFKDGYFLAPTVIENLHPDHELSKKELFGPITLLYKVKDYREALLLTNNSPYGLTASIHTKNFHRANHFIQNVKTGVVVVNGGTHGSEPHMPFGGFKQSGNGTREPGTEAIDVYSELKDVYQLIDPEQL
jgi:aldehyde dehydrogenase (NAD+)